MWTRRLITILAIAALPASAEAQLGTVLREGGQLFVKLIANLIGSLRSIDPPEPTKIPLDLTAAGARAGRRTSGIPDSLAAGFMPTSREILSNVARSTFCLSHPNLEKE